MLPTDLRSELRWLGSGFLLTLSSGFGQTYFIALFAGELKASLAITDGQFGTLYTLATLASAALLTWAGKLADRFSARALGVGVLAAFALTSLGMATVTSAWVLGIVLFGLRFLGQGMLTHVAMTAMGRWFNRKRGRAVSIAALGFPAGEALLPVVAVALMGLVGWRGAWLGAAGALALISIPVLTVLLRRERQPSEDVGGDAGLHTAKRDWTRGEVLRSPGPAGRARDTAGRHRALLQSGHDRRDQGLAAFLVRGELSGARCRARAVGADGRLADRPLRRPAAAAGAAASARAGDVDGDVRGEPLHARAVHGARRAVTGRLVHDPRRALPELFGLAHLGAIRAVVTAGVVFASALAPGAIGVLLDAGVAIEAQFLAMAVYCLVAAAWMAVLLPSLNRVAAAGPVSHEAA